MTAPLRHSAIANSDPLRLGRGKRSSETLATLAERDALLREAASFYPGASCREAARRLRTDLLRYQTGAWRRERTAEQCPPRHTGKVAAVCWRVLELRDAVPSERTIRRAFRGPPNALQSLESSERTK